MPDIDVDFEDERRQEVIEHIKEFYGEDHVSGVITFGKLQAKNAIRDAARVLGQPYSVGDRLCKMVGDELGITIDKALDANPDFKKAYDEEPKPKKSLTLRARLRAMCAARACTHARLLFAATPWPIMFP